MSAKKEITNVQDLLEEFKSTKLVTRAHAHVRTWFRGQPAFDKPLVPGVYRPNFPVISSEPDRLNTEQHLTQEFRIESSGLRAGRDSMAEIYFLQQHYKMPTRLLDWTTDPLAALYFASKEDPNDRDADGELFLMDAYKLAPTQSVDQNVFAGIGSQRNLVFVAALKVIFEWGEIDEFPNFLVPVRPDFIDARINSQSSCFTFHVPIRKELTIKENSTLVSFKIPAASKNTILKELFLLGVDDFSIFGDLEGLSRRLRQAHSIA